MTMSEMMSIDIKLNAIKFLIAELSEVSRTRYLTVKILSADFIAPAKQRKKSLLPSKNRHYVSD